MKNKQFLKDGYIIPNLTTQEQQMPLLLKFDKPHQPNIGNSAYSSYVRNRYREEANGLDEFKCPSPRVMERFKGRFSNTTLHFSSEFNLDTFRSFRFVERQETIINSFKNALNRLPRRSSLSNDYKYYFTIHLMNLYLRLSRILGSTIIKGNIDFICAQGNNEINRFKNAFNGRNILYLKNIDLQNIYAYFTNQNFDGFTRKIDANLRNAYHNTSYRVVSKINNPSYARNEEIYWDMNGTNGINIPLCTALFDQNSSVNNTDSVTVPQDVIDTVMTLYGRNRPNPPVDNRVLSEYKNREEDKEGIFTINELSSMIKKSRALSDKAREDIYKIIISDIIETT